MFHFMIHDKWSNVLMIHWRIPSHLEPILADHVSPFQLDKTTLLNDNNRNKEGSAWIGLVLITEQNVGPAIFRSNWTTVTHHGVNVRTYVKGPDDDVGIHFASLECDDIITSFGANIFGMPYKVADIERSYDITLDDKQNAAGGWKKNDHDTTKLLEKDVLSTSEIDDIMCKDGDTNKRVQTFRLKSVRTTKRSNPSLIDFIRSLLDVFWGMIHKMFFIGQQQQHKVTPTINKTGSRHSTKLNITPKDSDCTAFLSPNDNNNSSNGASTDKKDDTFTIEAQWKRHLSSSSSPLPPKLANLAQFFFERYHVYTKKYGLKWKGTIQHDPWPIEKAVLKHLAIRNIDAYEPKQMRPILQHMANKVPESVLFSSGGVGPIQFEMLRPV